MAFVIVACIAYFIPPLKQDFWMISDISSGLNKLPRLKLLTYEASYYSLLLVPVAMYIYMKAILLRLPNGGLMIFLVTLPLLLSFSLGTLLGLPLAIAILLVLNLDLIFIRRKIFRYLVLILIIAFITFIVLIFFFPENPLFTRLFNVLHGKDSSFRGRTIDSYQLAWMLVHGKGILFGIGLGQIKVAGLEIWREFYGYNFTINQIAIPCAVAETFAVFGIFGICLRFGLQFYFFFRTKVYSDYYRLSLFIFIFIYQFTGSYIYNIAEYVIWILAFTDVFQEFKKSKINLRIPA